MATGFAYIPATQDGLTVVADNTPEWLSECAYGTCRNYSGLATFCEQHLVCECELPMAHNGDCAHSEDELTF